VIFEATGSYERILRSALEAAGLAYVRVNPARARHDEVRPRAARLKLGNAPAPSLEALPDPPPATYLVGCMVYQISRPKVGLPL